MKLISLQWISCCLLLLVLAGGCASREQTKSMVPAQETGSQSQANSYKGKIDSLSKRAKTLFLIVGAGNKAKTVVVKFDDATKGVNDLAVGHFVTVDYELRGGEAYATNVQRNIITLPQGVTAISTDELLGLIRERISFVLVDPRPGEKYRQSHLPGSVSIPNDLSEQQQVERLPREQNRLLVFYDGGHGHGSTAINAAAAAKNRGFTDVRVYTGGRADWVEDSLPTYSTREFLHNGNALVIDMRPVSLSVAGRIKGAYHLVPEQFKTTLGHLPKDTPIVLYGDREKEALETLTDEGFTAVTLLEGGYAAWVKSGGLIEKGPHSSTASTLVRKVEQGEMSLDDFRKTVSGQNKETLLIDVRSPGEINARNAIANAINIPLDELSSREATLPRDKTLSLFCATGARAKMAYNKLTAAGFKAQFLRMTIEDIVLALQAEQRKGKSVRKPTEAVKR